MPLVDRATPPNIRVIDEVKLYPRYPSGLLEGQSPLYRYGYSDCQHPILKLADYITDYNGKYLKPGMYELALSDDKEFLLFVQSGELMAVVPVFKLAENQADVKKYRERQKANNKGSYKKRKLRNKDRFEKVLARKYAEDSITPETSQDYIYQNAEIEYIEDGGYYLVTYENGMYRAWGAIKTRSGFGKNLPRDIRGKYNINK